MEQQQKQAPIFESVWALLEKHAQELEKSAQKSKYVSDQFSRIPKSQNLSCAGNLND